MGWLLLAGRGVFYVPRRLAGFNFPLAAPSSTAKLGVFGEDCLSEASSAAAQFCEAAQEISGSGVSFSWVTFFSGS